MNPKYHRIYEIVIFSLCPCVSVLISYESCRITGLPARAFAMAILVIYMVLGILYESFIHPITILTALPFAGLGALLTLLIFDQELSLYAFVGIIMLIGIVKKNGIMMVDFALESQRNEPLGLAVLGGLLFSQILTLHLTPVFFVYMDRVQTRFGKGFSWRRGKKESGQIIMEPAKL